MIVITEVCQKYVISNIPDWILSVNVPALSTNIWFLSSLNIISECSCTEYKHMVSLQSEYYLWMFLHWVQTYGFSPVWILSLNVPALSTNIWFLSSLNIICECSCTEYKHMVSLQSEYYLWMFLHWVQTYGFSPVWILSLNVTELGLYSLKRYASYSYLFNQNYDA